MFSDEKEELLHGTNYGVIIALALFLPIGNGGQHRALKRSKITKEEAKP